MYVVAVFNKVSLKKNRTVGTVSFGESTLHFKSDEIGGPEIVTPYSLIKKLEFRADSNVVLIVPADSSFKAYHIDFIPEGSGFLTVLRQIVFKRKTTEGYLAFKSVAIENEIKAIETKTTKLGTVSIRNVS